MSSVSSVLFDKVGLDSVLPRSRSKRRVVSSANLQLSASPSSSSAASSSRSYASTGYGKNNSEYGGGSRGTVQELSELAVSESNESDASESGGSSSTRSDQEYRPGDTLMTAEKENFVSSGSGGAVGEPAWLREALRGERLGEAVARPQAEYDEELRRFSSVDDLAEQDQMLATKRAGSSLTELRRLTAALEEAAQPAVAARQDVAGKRAGVCVRSAQSVAQNAYLAARRERSLRLEAQAQSASVDEVLSADPFEREAYKPLVVMKEELVRDLSIGRAKEISATAAAAEEQARKEKQEKETLELEDALAAAESAQAAQLRRERRPSFEDDHTMAFGVAPTILQKGASSHAKAQALLWKRAAAAAHRELDGEKSKFNLVAEVAEAAAEAAATAAAVEAATEAEAMAERLATEESGAQAHRGDVPVTLGRAVKFAAWGARAKQRVKQRHEAEKKAEAAARVLAAAKPPTIKFVPRQGEDDGDEGLSKLQSLFGEEMEVLLVQARQADTSGEGPMGAASGDAMASTQLQSEKRRTKTTRDQTATGSPTGSSPGVHGKGRRKRHQSPPRADKQAVAAKDGSRHDEAPTSWVQMLDMVADQKSAESATLEVDEKMKNACEDAKRLSWVAGMNDATKRDLEMALGDTRVYSSDGTRGGHGAAYHHHSHYSRQDHLKSPPPKPGQWRERRKTAHARPVKPSAKPVRGGPLVASLTKGSFIDQAADTWLDATRFLVKRGLEPNLGLGLKPRASNLSYAQGLTEEERAELYIQENQPATGLAACLGERRFRGSKRADKRKALATSKKKGHR